MTNLFNFVLGILCLPILFFVAPISTTVILGLFLLWCLGWLILFLIVFIPRAKAAWKAAKAEIQAEDEAWDTLLTKYWNSEYSGHLIAAKAAGLSPTVAKISIQQNEDAQQAKYDTEVEMIKDHDAKDAAIEREKMIAYWIARHTKRKHKASASNATQNYNG